MTLSAALCAVLGGHAWQGPRIINGRLRMVCGHGCGAMSVGVETRGQEAQRVAREQAERVFGWRADRSRRRLVA